MTGPWHTDRPPPVDVTPAVEQAVRGRLGALLFDDAQRTQLRAVLVALDAGTATTLQHQRVTARLIRSLLRED